MSDNEVFDKFKEIIKAEDTLADAIYKFNLKPSQGIKYLCEYYHVKETPPMIAHILDGCDGLNEARVADYLTENENAEILDCYFESLDLTCEIVEAMRRCFSNAILMPADSQRINNAITSMSRVYFRQNKGAFNSEEDCYSIVYLIIMLNSDINNPNNPRPMTLPQFISNSREKITEDQMTDADFKRVYREIKSNPFTFKTEHPGNFLEFCAPSCKGMLWKKKGLRLSFWMKHFFVLANSCLFYFKSDDPKYKDHPLGSISLSGVTINKSSERLVIELESPTLIQYTKFKKTGPSPVLGVTKVYLKAANIKEYNRWFYRMQTSATLKASYPMPPTVAKKAVEKKEMPLRPSPVQPKTVPISISLPNTTVPDISIPYSDEYSSGSISTGDRKPCSMRMIKPVKDDVPPHE